MTYKRRYVKLKHAYTKRVKLNKASVQRTENSRVGGSIPSLGTTYFKGLHQFWCKPFFMLLFCPHPSPPLEKILPTGHTVDKDPAGYFQATREHEFTFQKFVRMGGLLSVHTASLYVVGFDLNIIKGLKPRFFYALLL